jgi:hypothetical protein
MDSHLGAPRKAYKPYPHKITFADNKTLLLSDKTFQLLKDKSKTIKNSLKNLDETEQPLATLTLNAIDRNVFIGLLPWIKKNPRVADSTPTQLFSNEDLTRPIELLKASNYLELIRKLIE